jgi:hypothetical protein
MVASRAVPSAQHLCPECASAEELSKASRHEEKKEKHPKIIFLDRFR